MEEGSRTQSDSEQNKEFSRPRGIELGPSHLRGSWKEPASRVRKLTLAILLPTGMESDDFNLAVIDKGRSFVFESEMAGPNDSYFADDKCFSGITSDI